MIDADPVDTVGGYRIRLRHCVDYLAVDDVFDLTRADAHFECVDGLAVRVRLLHRIARRFWRDVLGRLAVAALDQPGPILRDEEVRVALLRAAQVAAA